MSNLEFLINALAVVTFIWLFYKLALIVLSLPAALRRVNITLLTLTSIHQACQSAHESCTKGWLQDLLTRFHLPNDSGRCPARMIEAVVLPWTEGDSQLTATRFALWMKACSGDWRRHWSLAACATDQGMLYTVAGGVFAFAHIGKSEEPFAAFSALSLAMLTTAAGLIIAIVTKSLLGTYQHRLECLEHTAIDVTSMIASQLRQSPNRLTSKRLAPPESESTPPPEPPSVDGDRSLINVRPNPVKSGNRMSNGKYREDIA
jgi:hypothetical protein